MRSWRAVVRVLRSPSGGKLLDSSGPRAIARTAFDDLITTVFPADCRVCGGPLLRAGTIPVCDACVSEVPSQNGTMCGRCGQALGLDLDLEDTRFLGMLPEGVLCTPCRMVPPDFSRAVAYGMYTDELRRMVHLLKYEQMRQIARPLGVHLATAIASLEPDVAQEMLVVAVPLFPARQAQRGYNQSILLAEAALAVLKKSRPDWRLTPAHESLIRVKNTESQYALSARGRRANLKGAFQAPDKASIAGREVLLIDDIYTTGATARECARVLRRAGAAKVWVATLARAQVERVAKVAEPTEDVVMWGS